MMSATVNQERRIVKGSLFKKKGRTMNTNKLKTGFLLDEQAGYFRNLGVDCMAFDDFYPEGHQSGVSILMHGKRICTNGDLRFEQCPGQWQPVPKKMSREMSAEENRIVSRMHYPDIDRHLRGFNPMIYPDCEMDYSVSVTGEENGLTVRVDLDAPVPEEFLGKLSFNLEFFPGWLFGKSWIMDQKSGVFPRQANGPVLELPSNYEHSGSLPEIDGGADRKTLSGDHREYNPIIADDLIAEPYAVGRRFTACPEEPLQRITITSETADLKLYDGRLNHNNGWFVLSSEVPGGKTEGAIIWHISPNVDESWIYPPVVQVSQVGYHPKQKKTAFIELDARDTAPCAPVLVRLTAEGEREPLALSSRNWGKFLRYNYITADFTSVTEEGLYFVRCGNSKSSVFRIAEDVYDRGVWQPVLEYFLPVQMCHMKVREKYRVWHGRCHMDDAKMAPKNYTLFDGYRQGKDLLSPYQPGETVPGLNKGGWHDAGDFDLRVESQAGECYKMALCFEEFGVDYDATTIDQLHQITEIHQPDGKNDILQQIEHGLLTVLGSYRAFGRLYRGIICSSLRQYVMLGDAAAMTDGVQGDEDDRWVFTEDNPPRELTMTAYLAASSRAMRSYSEALEKEALDAAESLYKVTKAEDERAKLAKVHAAAELYLTTKDPNYLADIVSARELILSHMQQSAWYVCRVIHEIQDKAFVKDFREALLALAKDIREMSLETPYGIPYRPKIWGAGWEIQGLAVNYYFLYKAFPDIFPADLLMNALNFVLGCHPGSNTASFASGVGTVSTTTAYGMNRADWSYIPGGVVSGTALIRPDFPELLVFPFLWQQTEYVMGGGSLNYMFLVLAVQSVLKA